MGETTRRVLVALPLGVLAIVIVLAGGPWFAGAVGILGLIGLREFFMMSSAYAPFRFAAYLGLVGLVAAALLGTAFNILLFLAVPFLLVFAAAVHRSRIDGVTGSMAITLFGLFWVGIPLAHAVLLRDLPDHGAALMFNVLIGTFAADTGAYAIGRLFGRHKLAPHLSPNKTIEGLIGGLLIGTIAVWCAGLYQDWFSGVDALVLGGAVALTAVVGDLFESMIKRDLGAKDTSTLFGPHGGLLDRLDAVFFTVVVGYYVSVALIY